MVLTFGVGKIVNRGVASSNIVTTDFNPLEKKRRIIRAVGSTHIKSDLLMI